MTAPIEPTTTIARAVEILVVDGLPRRHSALLILATVRRGEAPIEIAERYVRMRQQTSPGAPYDPRRRPA